MAAILKLLISHSTIEQELAEAWQKLIETISLGAIKVWFSSDKKPLGGMPVGKEWRPALYGEIAQSDFVLAIQTKTTVDKPWIIWECGVASGIDKARGIIPIVYDMELSDLPDPLNVYQGYKGDDSDHVKQLCERLVHETGVLLFDKMLYTRARKSYFSNTNLYLTSQLAAKSVPASKTISAPRSVSASKSVSLWMNRIDDLVRSESISELKELRNRMYASLGKHPIDLTLHKLLSQLLLENRDFHEAVEETNYALALKPDDPLLLHRKALALTELKDYEQAKAIIAHVVFVNKNLDTNAEITSLQGRIYREQWRTSHNLADLEKALNAYLHAYQADPSSYYAGVNVIGLAFAKGDMQLGEKIAHEVLALCKQEQKSFDPSYWGDFTAGEVYLALGDATQAIDEYEKGLQRNPKPQQRQRHSAANGAARMIQIKQLPKEVLDRIDAILC